LSRFLTENRFTLFLEPLQRTEEIPRRVAEGGGEAVAEIHLQLRLRHKRTAAAAQRRDPSLERRPGGDSRTAVTAVPEAVAVAGLAASFFTSSGLRNLARRAIKGAASRCCVRRAKGPLDLSLIRLTLPRQRFARGGGTLEPRPDFLHHSNHPIFRPFPRRWRIFLGGQHKARKN
jgi:hypothetical protein